uniref:PUM-HD domain-containing protein n=1 Tax=Alexandrium monilatum TaxID=311494 RepID=A0A7S4Q2B9_9DINO
MVCSTPQTAAAPMYFQPTWVPMQGLECQGPSDQHGVTLTCGSGVPLSWVQVPQPLCQQAQCAAAGYSGASPTLVVCMVSQPLSPGVVKAPALPCAAEESTTGDEAAQAALLRGGQRPKLSASTLRRRRRQRATLLASLRRSEELATDNRETIVQLQGVGDVADYTALVDAINAGGEARAAAIASLHGRVAPLSFDAAGCRAVQLALQSADGPAVAEFASELQGHVREAIRSPHANYVIQKVIEVLPAAHFCFIAEELQGQAVEAACHRYGCRVFCRLLEHCPTAPAPAALVDEALMEATALCRHAFGHFVAQSVLEHGLPMQRRRVAAVLLADPLGFARHRSARHVLEGALEHAGTEDRAALVAAFLGCGPGELAELAQDQHGAHLARALLELPGGATAELRTRFRVAVGQLRSSRHGRRLAEDLGL